MKNIHTLLVKTLIIISCAQNTTYGNNFPEIENITEFIMKYLKKSRTLFLGGDHWKSNLEANSSKTEDTVFNTGLHGRANNKCFGWNDIIFEGEISGRFKIDRSGQQVYINSQITMDGHASENELSPVKSLKFKKEMIIKDSNSKCRVIIDKMDLPGSSKITFDCNTTVPYERNMFR